MWIIYALFSAITAALVAILGKIGIERIDSTLATTVRSLVMAGLLVVFSLALGKASQVGSLDKKALLYIFLSGLAGTASWLFYFLALKDGTAHGVVAIDRLSVVFVVILAAIFLKESLTMVGVLGAVLMVSGAIMLSFK